MLRSLLRQRPAPLLTLTSRASQLMKRQPTPNRSSVISKGRALNTGSAILITTAAIPKNNANMPPTSRSEVFQPQPKFCCIPNSLSISIDWQISQKGTCAVHMYLELSCPFATRRGEEGRVAKGSQWSGRATALLLPFCSFCVPVVKLTGGLTYITVRVIFVQCIQ